jgi:hypothetical protein
MRNRTADLLLTMETLCLLSYRGARMPRGRRHQRTKIHTDQRPRRITSVGIEDHTASVRCGSNRAASRALLTRSVTAASIVRFMPQASLVCSRASVGDKPFSAWSRAGICPGQVSDSGPRSRWRCLLPRSVET